MARPILILVPGIAGSELWKNDFRIFGFRPAENRVWVNRQNIFLGQWALMELGADGVTPPPNREALIPGPPLYWDFYKPWIDSFNGPYDLRMLNWDWRQPYGYDGQRLSDYILGLPASSKVRIVAHSRGGLITKVALRNLQSAGALDRVERVVGCGVPHHGSYAIVGLMGGWVGMVADIIHMLAAFGATRGGAAPPTAIKREMIRVINTFPAVYQLLPDPFYSGMVSDQGSKLYDPANWHNSRVPIIDQRLSEAKTYWQQAVDDPVGPRWKSLIGKGRATPNLVRDFDRLDAPDSLTYDGDGDGQVLKDWTVTGNADIIEGDWDHDSYFTTLNGRLAINDALNA